MSHLLTDEGPFANLATAIKALKKGKPILLLDDESRENEGDLVVSAELITQQTMTFLIKEGSGIVCLTLPEEKLKELQLPPMVEKSTNRFETAFTVSIEATNNISTGVSAQDRVTTIKTAIKKDSRPEDLARPGHVFPLKARDGGVLTRAGHTEGSVDLMKIAGLAPAGVICELMNPDGTMAKGEELLAFAHKHKIPLVTLDEVMAYRLVNENLFEWENPSVSSLLVNDIEIRKHSFSVAGEEIVLYTKVVLAKLEPKSLIFMDLSHKNPSWTNLCLGEVDIIASFSSPESQNATSLGLIRLLALCQKLRFYNIAFKTKTTSLKNLCSYFSITLNKG